MTSFLTHVLSEWRNSILIFKPSNLKLFVLVTLNACRQVLLNRWYEAVVILSIILFSWGTLLLNTPRLSSEFAWWIYVITIVFMRSSMALKGWEYIHQIINPALLIYIYILFLIRPFIDYFEGIFRFGAVTFVPFILVIMILFYFDNLHAKGNYISLYRSMLYIHEILFFCIFRGIYAGLLFFLFQLPFFLISAFFYWFLLIVGGMGFAALWMLGIPDILKIGIGFFCTVFYILLLVSWLTTLYIKKAHEDFDYYFPSQKCD